MFDNRLSSITESIGRSIGSDECGCDTFNNFEKTLDTVNRAVLFDQCGAICINS